MYRPSWEALQPPRADVGGTAGKGGAIFWVTRRSARRKTHTSSFTQTRTFSEFDKPCMSTITFSIGILAVIRLADKSNTTMLLSGPKETIVRAASRHTIR